LFLLCGPIKRNVMFPPRTRAGNGTEAATLKGCRPDVRAKLPDAVAALRYPVRSTAVRPSRPTAPPLSGMDGPAARR
jgi:hypothetical protein